MLNQKEILITENNKIKNNAITFILEKTYIQDMKKSRGINFVEKCKTIKQPVEINKEFNNTTKIGVFKELHKKGLLSYCELTMLIEKTINVKNK